MEPSNAFDVAEFSITNVFTLALRYIPPAPATVALPKTINWLEREAELAVICAAERLPDDVIDDAVICFVEFMPSVPSM